MIVESVAGRDAGAPSRVDVPPVGETITVQGRHLPLTRPGFAGTAGRNGTKRDGRLWYDRAGRRVRAEIDTRGDRLSLELVG